MHSLLRVEDTYFPINNRFRLKDKLFDFSKPKVMGIINCTPDSFYAESRYSTEIKLINQIEKMISDGVDILDIGGYSSRPGAKEISIQEEINRILPVLTLINKEFGSIPVSLDTFRSEVARIGLENGADLINDISAWEIDPELLNIVAHYKCPYVLMHMKGMPDTMQVNPQYNHLLTEMFSFFSKKIAVLHEKGITDILLDPGFGFGKTVEQNYEILASLDQFKFLGKPILAGFSRKSMIYKKLNSTPEASLNGTTALNTVALLKGAAVLRVHDVKEAKEIIELMLDL